MGSICPGLFSPSKKMDHRGSKKTIMGWSALSSRSRNCNPSLFHGIHGMTFSRAQSAQRIQTIPFLPPAPRQKTSRKGCLFSWNRKKGNRILAVERHALKRCAPDSGNGSSRESVPRIRFVEFFLRNLVREIRVDFGDFLKFPLCGFKKHKVSHADRSPSPFL